MARTNRNLVLSSFVFCILAKLATQSFKNLFSRIICARSWDFVKKFFVPIFFRKLWRNTCYLSGIKSKLWIIDAWTKRTRRSFGLVFSSHRKGGFVKLGFVGFVLTWSWKFGTFRLSILDYIVSNLCCRISGKDLVKIRFICTWTWSFKFLLRHSLRVRKFARLGSWFDLSEIRIVLTRISH